MEDPDGLYRRAFGGALRGQHGGGNEGLGRKLREELSTSPGQQGRQRREPSRGRAKRGHWQAGLRGEHPALHAPEQEPARQHAGLGRPHARDFRTLRADSAREASPAPRLEARPPGAPAARCWEEPRAGAGDMRTQGLRTALGSPPRRAPRTRPPGRATLGRRAGASCPRPEAGEGPRAEAVPTPGRPGPAEGPRGASAAEAATALVEAAGR